MQKNILFLLCGAILGTILTFFVIKVNQNIGDTNNSNNSVAAQTNSTIPKSDNVTTSIANGPVMGDKDKAKIAIVEFSDYECPFCKRFHDETLEQIKSNYIDNNQAIFVYRNDPLSFHEPAASKDATAAECVNSIAGSDKYYAMGDLMYKTGGLNGSGISTDNLVNMATSIGVDKDKFSTCLASNQFTDKITKDKAEAAAIGITGTPAFVIGKLSADGTVHGELVVGAQTYDTFKQAIDRQLAK